MELSQVSGISIGRHEGPVSTLHNSDSLVHIWGSSRDPIHLQVVPEYNGLELGLW